MALTQKRIRDLTTYTQLESGDPEYVPPSSLYVVFDSANFGSEPLKFPAEDLFEDSNVQKGRLTGLSSASVAVTFSTAFASTPITSLFEVFRYKEVVSGVWTKQSVKKNLGSATWLTSTGFSITIDSSESLTGVIIEYIFEEA